MSLLSLPVEMRLEVISHLPARTNEADLQSLRLSCRRFYILIPPPLTVYHPDSAIPYITGIRDWKYPGHDDFLQRLWRDIPITERWKWRVCTHCKHIKRTEEFAVDEGGMWLSVLEEGEERRGDWCAMCHCVGGVLGKVESHREDEPPPAAAEIDDKGDDYDVEELVGVERERIDWIAEGEKDIDRDLDMMEPEDLNLVLFAAVAWCLVIALVCRFADALAGGIRSIM